MMLLSLSTCPWQDSSLSLTRIPLLRMRSADPLCVARNADRSHSVLATHGDDDSENGRMHVHVVLRVDVIECEPGSRESLELRANLRFEIASRSRTEEKVYTRSHQIA